MHFTVITLFPEFFETPVSTSLIGKAKDAGVLHFDFINPREFGEGKHRAVDDRPYGGGPGMVMMAPVLERAVEKAVGGRESLEKITVEVRAKKTENEETQNQNGSDPYIVFLSPQGKKLTSKHARALSAKKHLVLICGHYEGVDERAINAFVHEEISIGDYIITGGEAAAYVLIDAVSRFVPGVIGDMESVNQDTFEDGLKAPVYTRPQTYNGESVPEVLLSGNHALIAKWRQDEGLKRTRLRRPDLLADKK